MISLTSFIGIVFIITGAGLEEFALFRKGVSRRQRKCNDSKATLLLYFSTGICCDIVGVFLVPFVLFLIALSSHILFYIYFTYRLPPTFSFKFSSFLYLLSFCLALFQSDENEKNSAGSTSKNSQQVPCGILFIIFVLCLASSLVCRLVKQRPFKVCFSSGFGVIINLCMKLYVEMTYATLDDVYPSMFAVFFVLIVLITSTLAQSSITSVLMTKSQTYQVYAGYYLVNVMVCTLISQILYDEPVEAVTFFSIVLSVIASLVLSSERYSDKDLLFQELD